MVVLFQLFYASTLPSANSGVVFTLHLIPFFSYSYNRVMLIPDFANESYKKELFSDKAATADSKSTRHRKRERLPSDTPTRSNPL